VLGSDFESHFHEISHLPVQVVENEQWQNGMGHSLKTGLTALLKKWPHTSAVIVLVCDQPLLTTDHLENLIVVARTSDKPIISSCYKNVLGVPALFKKELFAELLALGDSEGARKLIQQKKNEVEAVDFPGGEIDLDTPEDVKRFLG
jgi:molybdenum cofactor cytidylyltransferase